MRTWSSATQPRVTCASCQSGFERVSSASIFGSAGASPSPIAPKASSAWRTTWLCGLSSSAATFATLARAAAPISPSAKAALIRIHGSSWASSASSGAMAASPQAASAYAASSITTARSFQRRG